MIIYECVLFCAFCYFFYSIASLDFNVLAIAFWGPTATLSATDYIVWERLSSLLRPFHPPFPLEILPPNSQIKP